MEPSPGAPARLPSLSPVGAPAPTMETRPPESYRASPLGTLMNVVLGLDLFVVGLSVLIGLFVGLAILADPSSAVATSTRRAYVSGVTSWATMLFNFTLFGGIPLLWILATRTRPIEGTRRYLSLRSPLRSAAIGSGLAGWFAGPILLIGFLVSHGSVGTSDPASAARLAATPWLVLVGTAAAAGVGEEIFFRGLLYRWTGWWAQGILFMLAHFANGEPLQLALSLTMGLAFGWLRRSGWSLVALAAAHTTYDAVLLGVAKYASQAVAR